MADDHLDSATTMKLLIDRERGFVFLGVGGKAYEEMHDRVLRFPMASAVGLARRQAGFEAYGCFTNLYRSVQCLSLQCFQTPACKQMLLHPRPYTRYFTCADFCKRGSEVLASYYDTIRCDCGKFMNKELDLQHAKKGFAEVKEQHRHEGPCRFLVRERRPYLLHPSSPTNLLHFLKKRSIICMSQLEEKDVTVGLEQDTFIGVVGMEEAMNHEAPLVRRSKKKSTGGKATTPLLTVDVLVRKSDRRILFAVANKDFIDLLFTFLTLPLMMVWDMIGFRWSKRALAKPRACKLPPYYTCHRLLPNCKAEEVPPLVISSHTKRAYESQVWLLDYEDLVCLIDPKSPFRHSTDCNGGYAKDEQVFLVSDDLAIHHHHHHLPSTSSTISLAKHLGIPLSDVETQKISIGEKEALQLLEASFHSSSALTIGLGSCIASSSRPKKLTSVESTSLELELKILDLSNKQHEHSISNGPTFGGRREYVT